MSKKNAELKLGKSPIDWLISIGRIIPIHGIDKITNILAEFIPNQRIDRIAFYVEQLFKDVEVMKVTLKSLEEWTLKDKKRIYILEESFRIAGKTYDKEKLTMLASIVKQSIFDKIDIPITEKFLFLIDALTLDQLVILYIKYMEYYNWEFFKELESKYKNIYCPNGIHDDLEFDKRSELTDAYIFNVCILQKYNLLSEFTNPNFASRSTMGLNTNNFDHKYVQHEINSQIQELFQHLSNSKSIIITTMGKRLINSIDSLKEILNCKEVPNGTVS